MIRFIQPEQPDLAEALLAILRKEISQYWPEVEINLRSCMDYWKYDKHKVIIYSVAFDSIMTVYEFIKKFNINWECSGGEVYDVDTLQEYDLQNAIWSKRCHPTEMFLSPIVTWVHIYTWPDDI